MLKRIKCVILTVFALLTVFSARAQYKTEQRPLQASDTTFLTLDQALQIALSENVSVKVADKEIERLDYAKKGTYASLFPQVNISGAYQRTIKKQVMYMDFDMSSLGGVPGEGTGSGTSAGEG